MSSASFQTAFNKNTVMPIFEVEIKAGVGTRKNFVFFSTKHSKLL